jgi:hypothetical protein
VEQHLGEGELRAERDAGAVEPFGVRIERAVAPAHEVEIVAEPAQQRLERVTVRVHGARQQRLAPEPEVAGLARIDRLDAGHAAVGDRDRATRLPAGRREDEIRQQSHRA